MAEAGPVPHLPENGKVVAFRAQVDHGAGGGIGQSTAG
jgi:hypothetical protein